MQQPVLHWCCTSAGWHALMLQVSRALGNHPRRPRLPREGFSRSAAHLLRTAGRSDGSLHPPPPPAAAAASRPPATGCPTWSESTSSLVFRVRVRIRVRVIRCAQSSHAPGGEHTIVACPWWGQHSVGTGPDTNVEAQHERGQSADTKRIKVTGRRTATLSAISWPRKRLPGGNPGNSGCGWLYKENRNWRSSSAAPPPRDNPVHAALSPASV